MTESTYAGAYWRARGESLAACADRTWLLLTRVKEISPLFEQWYPKKRSAQELTASSIKNIDEVQAMLSKNRSRRDDNGEIIEQLGFSFNAWNGEDDESKSLDVSIHLGATSVRVKNNLVIRMPRGSNRLSEQQNQALLKMIIEVVDPEYATISSHQCREKLSVGKEFVFGWEGYVRAPISAPSTSRVAISNLGIGTLLKAKLEQFSSSDEKHLAAVKELNDIVKRQHQWKSLNE
jgi:hypothetical protein